MSPAPVPMEQVQRDEVYQMFDAEAFSLHEWNAVKESMHSQDDLFGLIRRDAKWVMEDKHILHLFWRACRLR